MVLARYAHVPRSMEEEVDTTAEVSEDEDTSEQQNTPPFSSSPPLPAAGVRPPAAAIDAFSAAHYGDVEREEDEEEDEGEDDEDDDEEEEEEAYCTPQKVRGFHNMLNVGANSPSPRKKRSRPLYRAVLNTDGAPLGASGRRDRSRSEKGRGKFKEQAAFRHAGEFQPEHTPSTLSTGTQGCEHGWQQYPHQCMRDGIPRRSSRDACNIGW